MIKVKFLKEFGSVWVTAWGQGQIQRLDNHWRVSEQRQILAILSMQGIFQMDYCITHKNAGKFREPGWGTQQNWRELHSKSHSLNHPHRAGLGGHCQHSGWTLGTVAWLTQHAKGSCVALKTPTATAAREFSTVSTPVDYSARFSVWDGYFWLAKLRCGHQSSSCKRGWEATHLPFLVSTEGNGLCL